MTEVEQTTKKKLNELRVVDLRHELEKRGLDKNGVKPALVDKLTKAIEEEGKNPEEYYFDIVVEKPSTKPVVKRSSRKLKEDEADVVQDEDDEDNDEDENQEENQNALSKEDATDVEEINANLSEENPQCNGNETDDGVHKSLDESHLSPPKPETSPVLAPLTIEDIIKLDTSSKVKASDNDSLIVNPDDTQSDIDSSIHEKESVDEALQDGEENAAVNCKPDFVEDAEMNAGDHPSADKSDCQTSKSDSEKDQSTNKEVKVSKNESMSSSKCITDDKTAEKGKISQVDDSVVPEKTSADTSTHTTDSSKRKSSTDEKAPADGNKNVAGGKNLWVSGLAEKTRANDLKALFSKYGKVATAKIVTNAKTPGARCYGFITMATNEEAVICIEKLNQTALHGKTISVETTNREPTGSIKRTELKAIQKSAQKKPDTKKGDEKSDTHKDSKSSGKDSSKSGDRAIDDKSKTDKSRYGDKTKNNEKDKGENKKDDKDNKREGKKYTFSRERRVRDRSRERRRRDRRSRSRSRSHGRSTRFSTFRGGYFRGSFNRGVGVRHFAPSRNFDDRFRERERSRERDLDRRRMDIIRQRDIERQNKEESIRLERERERLRIEREKLERERAEVLRLEREKQRLERERLEREKIELRKRTQMTLEERRGIKRSFDMPLKESDPFWDDRKRHAPHRDTSIGALSGFEDFNRSSIEFAERRSDFERSKSDMSPAFTVSSRREGKREHERSPFHRGRGSRDMPERGRGDWKNKPNRDRSFERERNSFNDRGRNFDRPNPWESGAPSREQNKFGNDASMGNSQWGPVTKTPENWSRVEQPPAQDRWGNADRGQTSLGHPPNLGPNQLIFSGGPTTNDMINPMGNHFPVDRFNPNVMRRF